MRASASCVVSAFFLLGSACGGDAAQCPCAAVPASPVASASGAPVASAAPSASEGVIAFDIPRAGEFRGPRLEPPSPTPSGTPALPSAVTRDDASMSTLVAVDIAADGTLYLNGERVEADALRAKARQAHAVDPEVRAIIRADVAAKHGNVIHVLDVLRQVGIAKIAFAVAPEAK